jgi:hypothetical protein
MTGLLGVTGFLCGDLFISIIDVKMNLRIHDGSQRPKKSIDLQLHIKFNWRACPVAARG